MADSSTTREKSQMGKLSSRASESFASPIQNKLPPLNIKLIGRDQDILAIQKLLVREDIQLLTLTGLGGVGKTSLLLQTINTLADGFPDGICFVNLAPLIKSELIMIEIANSLAVKHNRAKEILDSISAALANRRVLLALDNFEHLMPGASQVNDLLLACPTLKIIVTSREPLRLRSEQAYPVHPLDMDHAVELFTKRAQSLDPSFSLTSGDRASVAELCRRLDGLPLAIELAALRTRSFAPQSLLARLQPDLEPASRILDLLSSGARDLPERQQSLRKTIEWSYGLLDPQEQSTLRVASVFPAGFTIQTLAAVMHYDESIVLQSVSSLVDKSLVKPAPAETGHQRFVLLEAIREYAWDEIKRLGEIASLQDAYISTYLILSEKVEAKLWGERQEQWIASFHHEFMNINLALEMCLTFPRGSETWKCGFRILGNFRHAFVVHGQFLFAEQYLTRALNSIEACEKDDNAGDDEIMLLKANIYVTEGNLAWSMGSFREGANWHEAAYHIFERLDDKSGMAEALDNWAVNLGSLGEYPAALEKHERGLNLNRKIGNRWGEVRQLNNLGNMYHILGQDEEALAVFEQGLSIARELKDEYFISYLLCNLAHLKVHTGEYEAAISLLRTGRESVSKMETEYIHGWFLAISGRAHLNLGKVDTAIRETLEGIDNLKHISEVSLKIEFLEVAVGIFIHLGHAAEAAQVVGALSRVRSELGIPEYPVDQERIRKQMEDIRSALTPEIHSAAEQKGRELTLDSALSFVVAQLSIAPPGNNESESLLTAREREVLSLLERGLTNEEISKELVVVVKTVEKHVANILMKLRVKNRTEAAAWAIANGIK